MSLNHILKDIVPDNQKLNVRFGIVEADSIITSSSFASPIAISPVQTSDHTSGYNVTANELINGALVCDDNAKLNFIFNMPLATALDTALNLSGTTAGKGFKFNVNLPSTLPNTNTIKLQTSVVSKIKFKSSRGAETEVTLQHFSPNESNITFSVVRQSSGEYWIYG